jgi:tetratricopeptide (TPR) repeat protein
MGMFLLAHAFYKESRECFARAEVLDRAEPRWPYFQGFTLLLEGNTASALPKLERTIALCASALNDPELRLAEALATEGREEEARDHFQQVLRRDPDNPRAHLGLGRLAAGTDQLQEALEHLERCKESPYAKQATHALLVGIYQRLGNLNAAAAERSLADNMAVDPAWPDAFLDEASHFLVGKRAAIARVLEMLRHEQLAEATVAAEQLTQEYPEEGTAWLFLGRSLNLRNLPAAAERPLRIAAQLLPESVEAQFELGTVLARQKQYAEAEQCFRRVRQFKPSSATAHYNLGRCFEERGDGAGAIAEYREALRYKPNMVEAHRSLAEQLASKGRKEEAIQHLRDLLELTPNDTAAKARLQEWLRPRPSAPESVRPQSKRHDEATPTDKHNVEREPKKAGNPEHSRYPGVR